MAPAKGKAVKQTLKKRVKYTLIHKFAAGLALVAFLVTIIAGVMADARITIITYRAALVILVIGMVARIVLRTWASYEEMKGG